MKRGFRFPIKASIFDSGTWKIVSYALWFFAGIAATRAQSLNPASLPPVGHAELRILDPTLLELNLITTKAPDPAPVQSWNFVTPSNTLALPPGSEFDVKVGASAAVIKAIGFKRRPLYAPLKARDLRIQNSLYLRLEKPIPPNAKVTVQNTSGKLWDNATTVFTNVASPERFSPVIHVNQVGYVPEFPKTAKVGYYLGSLGEMPIAATNFLIINSSHQAVYSGALKRRPDVGFVYLPPPYQQVFEADFSAFKTPGEYWLEIPGLGVSYPFLIRESTGMVFARALELGLYHQRCGGPNELPYTRFIHAICHAAPADVPTMANTAVNQELAAMTADYASNPRHTAPQLKDVDSSLYPFVNTGPVDVSLGHHDAGDYSKYTIDSAALIHYLVFAADVFDGVGALDNLAIPESGDGKSDVLEEAKWEADFLAKMQDSDGGFYFLVYPQDREYEQDVLPDHGDLQVVFPKTTAATAAAVGALAEISSSPHFQRQFPNAATNYMAKAAKGWIFLTNAIAKFGKDGSYQKITHYGNEFMHDDELAWAAAAMFAATGNPVFQSQLMAWYDPSDPATRRWSWWRLFEGYGCAARCYVFASRDGRLPLSKFDPAYLAKMQDEIIAAADDVENFSRQSAYGTSFPTANKQQLNAGWYFSTERAFELAVAQELAPKPEYFQALLENVNYQAGCNPVNMPFITGLGWRRWREIVNQYAQNDYRTLPPSGLPLGNITAGFTWLDRYGYELGELCYPPDGVKTAPYPFYDRWGDSYNPTAEATIVDQARSLGTYLYLAGQTGATNSPVTHGPGSISGVPDRIADGEPITATFQANGVDLTEARIVWESTDQEPFIGPAFTFSAKTPGEQWIEVEAQLPDGNRIYATGAFTASVATNIPPNSYQSENIQPGNGVLALYHLDNSLADAMGKNPSLTLAGNARMDGLNLAWMAQRSGAALRFHDLGDAARVTLPGPLLNSTNRQEITLEAMIYLNAYKGWNRGTAKILTLNENWNANLGFIEDIYSGPHLRGGTQFDLDASIVNQAIPLRQWVHLALTTGPSGYSARVNGKEIGSAASSELADWNAASGALEVGNFDGWMDEIAIRNSAPPASLNAPGGLTAAATNRMVTLTWNAVANATAYNVKRAASPGGPFQTIATKTETGYADRAVQNGTTYYYAVSAKNGSSESANSVVVSARPIAPLEAPSDLTADRFRGHQIRLNWSDRSNNESGFEIERSEDQQTFVKIETLPENSTEYFDGDLRSGRYYYRVRAVNGDGVSAYSNVASARAR
jgi:hypothetical protein